VATAPAKTSGVPSGAVAVKLSRSGAPEGTSCEGWHPVQAMVLAKLSANPANPSLGIILRIEFSFSPRRPEP
jgi:hypothetical protein